jgi:hypothetical protein
MDPDGATVTSRVTKILEEEISTLRKKLIDEESANNSVANGRYHTQATRPPPPVPKVNFPLMANFPSDDDSQYFNQNRANQLIYGTSSCRQRLLSIH